MFFRQSDMRKVLIFKETLLQPSETFVLAQMRALSEYEPILVGLERAHPSLPLGQEPLLLSDRGPAISALRSKLYRRKGIAPLFHHQAKRLFPDLVHAHFASGGRSALPLARALRVPLVVTLHGNDVTVRGQRPDLYKRLGKEASLFICVSKFIRDRALEAGFPAHKLVVHYIGIDRGLFSPSTTTLTPQGVLFVGRLVEKKGCEYLIRAMQLVQRARPECELTVIGDGPLRLSLESLAKDLKVRCQFRGVQPATVIREELQKARIFCAPSLTAADGDSEGLGMVFAEAQAMGVPVVSTMHGGIPEVVVNRSTGLLTPERDYQALANALSVLLVDDGLWQQFHQAAPQHIEQHFDLQAQTVLLEDIYTEAIASNDRYNFAVKAKLQPVQTFNHVGRK
jgi:colanic acid/amylovoran biosynthesis glycosyltransferase